MPQQEQHNCNFKVAGLILKLSSCIGVPTFPCCFKQVSNTELCGLFPLPFTVFVLISLRVLGKRSFPFED